MGAVLHIEGFRTVAPEKTRHGHKPPPAPRGRIPCQALTSCANQGVQILIFGSPDWRTEVNTFQASQVVSNQAVISSTAVARSICAVTMSPRNHKSETRNIACPSRNTASLPAPATASANSSGRVTSHRQFTAVFFKPRSLPTNSIKHVVLLGRKLLTAGSL